MELQEQDIDLRLPEEAVPIEGTREEEVGQGYHMSGETEEDEEDDSSEEWVRDQHELDCPLCRALLFDPITTSCGHNFCRSCIVRYVHLPSSAPSATSPSSIDFSLIINSFLNKSTVMRWAGLWTTTIDVRCVERSSSWLPTTPSTLSSRTSPPTPSPKVLPLVLPHNTRARTRQLSSLAPRTALTMTRAREQSTAAGSRRHARRHKSSATTSRSLFSTWYLPHTHHRTRTRTTAHARARDVSAHNALDSRFKRCSFRACPSICTCSNRDTGTSSLTRWPPRAGTSSPPPIAPRLASTQGRRRLDVLA